MTRAHRPALTVSVALLSALACGSPTPHDVSGQQVAALQQADEVSAGPLVQASPGASPFGDGHCAPWDPSSPPHLGMEVEPSVAADPSDPSHLAGIFQQDRFETGSALGDLTAVSRDAGKTWHLSRGGPPAFSQCTGGVHQRASDPRVAIGVDGIAYAVGTTADFAGHFASFSGVAVAVSKDGGDHWGPAVIPYDQTVLPSVDQSYLIADDRRPGHAYWISRADSAPDAQGNSYIEGVFQSTYDGGLTWNPPVIVDKTLDTLGSIDDGDALVELTDGSLLRVFVKYGNNGYGSRSKIEVSRSLDLGVTWAKPVVVVSDIHQSFSILRQGGMVNIAADPRPGHEDVYVVWNSANAAQTVNAITMATSHDDGETWSAPEQVNTHPNAAALLSRVAVNQSGTVAVTYYDSRFATTTASLVDVWIVTRPSAAASWTERRVTTQSFDINKLPLTTAGFPFIMLGDYEGLTAAGNTFHPFFGIGTGQQTGDPSNIVTRAFEVE